MQRAIGLPGRARSFAPHGIGPVHGAHFHVILVPVPHVLVVHAGHVAHLRERGAREGQAGREDRDQAQSNHWTTMMPLIMSIPHTYWISPFGEAGSAISTASFNGKGFRMPCSGNTISFAQVWSVVRVTTSMTGFPDGTVIVAGANPLSVTASSKRVNPLAACLGSCVQPAASAMHTTRIILFISTSLVRPFGQPAAFPPGEDRGVHGQL